MAIEYRDGPNGSTTFVKDGERPLTLFGQAAEWMKEKLAAAPYYSSAAVFAPPDQLERIRNEDRLKVAEKASKQAEAELEQQEEADYQAARRLAESGPGMTGYEDTEQMMSVPETVYGRADLENLQSVPETEDDRRMRAAREFDQRGWIGVSGKAAPSGYYDEDRGMSMAEPEEMRQLRAARGEVQTEDTWEDAPKIERRGTQTDVERYAVDEAGNPTEAIAITPNEEWALAQHDPRSEEEEYADYMRGMEAYNNKYLENPNRPQAQLKPPPEPPVTTTDLLTTESDERAKRKALKETLKRLDNSLSTLQRM